MWLGINALNHDASVTLIDGNQIVFAAHAERYSRIKNDRLLNQAIVSDMRQYGEPQSIYWFEKPLLKSIRKLYSGERPIWESPRDHLRQVGLGDLPITYVPHHQAHAAMGYYTSGFNDAAILVIDAIGEWNTTTIWHGQDKQLEKIVSVNYPNSFGLFYSAFTQAIGLKPNEEEYILMGMAALGKPVYTDQIVNTFFSEFDPPFITLRYNLHRGMGDYVQEQNWNRYDVAASVQRLAERYILGSVQYAQNLTKSYNLVFVGGVSLNCVANGLLRDTAWFDNIWVPPNPGDAGLSLGAVLAHANQPVDFDNAYLGYNIDRELTVDAIVDSLLNREIVGVANGRAEFGPRALGNRSLLADPRGQYVKDRVNTIKKREPFRPFAPVILEEMAEKYFENVNHNQQYMQWTNRCLRPQEFPAICHYDNTSRIQTVPNNGSNIRRILDAWFEASGCPMLLNTSLNIKGEPLVNTWADAQRFQQAHNIKIY